MELATTTINASNYSRILSYLKYVGFWTAPTKTIITFSIELTIKKFLSLNLLNFRDLQLLFEDIFAKTDHNLSKMAEYSAGQKID